MVSLALKCGGTAFDLIEVIRWPVLERDLQLLPFVLNLVVQNLPSVELASVLLTNLRLGLVLDSVVLDKVLAGRSRSCIVKFLRSMTEFVMSVESLALTKLITFVLCRKAVRIITQT